MSVKSLLIDTSVWIEFLEKQARAIDSLIPNGALRCHPFVIGELVVGDLGRRTTLISALKAVRQLHVVKDADVVEFVRDKKLAGRGIGYIDCHLLASVYFERQTYLWTSDKRLRSAAVELGVAYPSANEWLAH